MHSINSTRKPVVAAQPQPIHPDGKEYIVTLVQGVDYAAFWTEMETALVSSHTVPARAVRVVNDRSLQQRICHYALSDAEAEKLRQDPRVNSVDIPLQYKPNAGIRHHATQVGNFNKPQNYSSTGNNINWGLPRVNSYTNIYEELSYLRLGDQGYDYTLDGTGVDVVIFDTGLEVGHPEFTDTVGKSRVREIDWYDESGVGGSMPVGYYTDIIGHGTHVAGIAAGKTFGWAKNASIYVLKLNDLTTDDTGLSITDCFDVLLGWHQNKSPDINTGYVRPTVVNMSWGTGGSYYTGVDDLTYIYGGVYRNTVWSGTGLQSDIHSLYGMGLPDPGTYPLRDAATDVAVEALIAAGIHVVVAAGNDFIKIDAPGGPDYNNYWHDSYNYRYYYQQGSSPYSPHAIITGSTDAGVYSATTDRKAQYSNGGPGVDIYAPGTAIYSATSNVNAWAADGYSPAAYYPDNRWMQANIAGTSMAAPQIAGLAALFLQINPHATPAQFKEWLIYNQGLPIYTSGHDNHYNDFNDTWGGDPVSAYNPLNNPVTSRVGPRQTEINIILPE